MTTIMFKIKFCLIQKFVNMNWLLASDIKLDGKLYNPLSSQASVMTKRLTFY